MLLPFSSLKYEGRFSELYEKTKSWSRSFKAPQTTIV